MSVERKLCVNVCLRSERTNESASSARLVRDITDIRPRARHRASVATVVTPRIRSVYGYASRYSVLVSSPRQSALISKTGAIIISE